MDSTILKPSSRQAALQLLLTTVPSSVIEKQNNDTITNLRYYYTMCVCVCRVYIIIINPWRTCATRVTVVVSVCLSTPNSLHDGLFVPEMMLCTHWIMRTSLNVWLTQKVVHEIWHHLHITEVCTSLVHVFGNRSFFTS